MPTHPPTGRVPCCSTRCLPIPATGSRFVNQRLPSIRPRKSDFFFLAGGQAAHSVKDAPLLRSGLHRPVAPHPRSGSCNHTPPEPIVFSSLLFFGWGSSFGFARRMEAAFAASDAWCGARVVRSASVVWDETGPRGSLVLPYQRCPDFSSPRRLIFMSPRLLVSSSSRPLILLPPGSLLSSPPRLSYKS